MVHLHYANRLESLVAPLADSISAQQRAQPLERVTIVVPNRVMQHFLQHRVSEEIGIAANLEFQFLRRFLAGIVETAEPALRILEVEELEWLLFECLRADLKNPRRDFSAPRSYIENGQPNEAERELRTLRLARQVARLFREYSIQRRPMLQRWLRQADTRQENQSETERWQRGLWTSIFGPNGELREKWKSSDCEYNWMLLPDALDAVPATKLAAALPPIVHVFGLSYLGPSYLRILAQIGNLTDLQIYALNPCLEFWEDVDDLSRIDRESWTRRHSKIAQELEDSPDPFGLETAADTPALRLWARPGREYIRMLNQLTECDFDAHFTHRSRLAPLSLLGNLQEDILTRARERPPAESDGLEADESIRFLACPGIVREAEIVANQIWSMLEDGAHDTAPIRFHQIAVIVPDAPYKGYLPHIENAFSRLHRLPFNVVSRGPQDQSPVREAVSLLLRLPLGRFSRDEMLRLLNHPVVRGEASEVDAEQAGRWCEELGILFGADAQDLANSYLPRDAYHWDQGIRRLALGVFLDPGSDQNPRFYSGPESIEYLPCETAQDEIPAVAGFIKNARALIADALEIRSARLTVRQWSRRLTDLIATHVKVDDPVDERMRDRCIEAFETLDTANFTVGPISYQIMHEIASLRMAELESQQTYFTETGIAVGRLSALHAMPFRAIFLLGLNEGQFPERDRRDPIDLRIVQRKVGDVTPTERDSYLFLDTLLSARERIFMSYVARDPKTGDRLDPSSVVRELRFILRGYVSSDELDRLTVEHPLSRYDDRYFPEIKTNEAASSPILRSYDYEARRGAIAAAVRGDLARHCVDLPLPGRDESVLPRLAKNARDLIRPMLRLSEFPAALEKSIDGEISLPISALRRFLECPLQGAARYALGIFEDESDALEQWQDEPVAHSILDRTTLIRKLFWSAGGRTELFADQSAHWLHLSRLEGRAPAGPFAEAAQRRNHDTLQLLWDQAHKAGCKSLDSWLEVRMGRGDVDAPPDRVIGELVVPLQLKTGTADTPKLAVKIHGSLGFLAPLGDASLRLVLRDKVKPKDFLGGMLSAIALAAASELVDEQFRAIVTGAGRHRSWNEARVLKGLTTQAARDYLSNLVSDLLFDKNHYFLPIEAVGDLLALKEEDGDDSVDVVNDLRENEFRTCSSDYGPIRDARRFEPPGEEALRTIIHRRFGLIGSIFAGEKR